MTEVTLSRARAGDEEAFRELTGPYMRELQLHCYRIVGSLQDSEDLLQETLLEASVNSALQRARATLDARLPAARSELVPGARSARERELVDRFVEAFQKDDIDGVVALLTDDALVTMPPEPLEYQGRDAVGGFLLDRARARAPAALRLIPTRANGQPAFGLYIEDGHAAFYRCFGLLVLTIDGERISAITRFRDSAVLALFGMPRTLQR